MFSSLKRKAEPEAYSFYEVKAFFAHSVFERQYDSLTESFRETYNTFCKLFAESEFCVFSNSYPQKVKLFKGSVLSPTKIQLKHPVPRRRLHESQDYLMSSFLFFTPSSLHSLRFLPPLKYSLSFDNASMIAPFKKEGWGCAMPLGNAPPHSPGTAVLSQV